MKKAHTFHKILSILLVCMLLVISAGSAYAGPPPFFRAPDTEHAQDTAQQESPKAFIQMEKPIFFGPPMCKRHEHHKEHDNSRKPERLTPAPGDFSQRPLGRMFIVLNFESQRLLPVPHFATSYSPQLVVVRLPKDAVRINQQVVVFAETLDDVAVTANHHLHQFQILLI